MPSVGVELPPHLKSNAAVEPSSSSDDDIGPSLPSSAKRKSTSPSSPQNDKRRRVIGPAPPPAPLSERPRSPVAQRPSNTHDPNTDSSSDDDDDIGPSLPTAGDTAHTQVAQTYSSSGVSKPDPISSMRDEWMLKPPEQDDLAARLDPSRIRARGFNTAKNKPGSTTGGKVDNAVWTETPEQTRQRLADEVLGKRTAGNGSGSGTGSGSAETDKASKARRQREERDAKLAAELKASRGPSLYEQHQKREAQKGKVEEDDPGKRAFDREKDMAVGGAAGLSSSQRRDALGKSASGFGSKFAGGGYL